MRNVTYKFEGKGEKRKLIIEVDMAGETTSSGSGKSEIIASSEGNEPIGDRWYIGINVYRKRTEEEVAKWRAANPELAKYADDKARSRRGGAA